MNAATQIDVVLPAGGRIEGEFAAEAKASIKALIRLNGTTILERTLQAVREAPNVHRVVVVGPTDVRPAISAQYAAGFVEEGDSGPENIFRGLEWLREANGGTSAERAMVMTTDLPFLTGEHVSGFLAACPEGADVSVPVYDRTDIEPRFPDWGAEYVALKDGNWATGCAFLVNPAHLIANRKHIEDIFAARKSQIAMGRLLGLGFVVKFLTHRLAVTDILRRCEQILGCSAAAVRGAAPELCFDLDSVDDLRYATGGHHE
jgi:molybdopterin-guanine dinucleotide biosynthesis protein A